MKNFTVRFQEISCYALSVAADTPEQAIEQAKAIANEDVEQAKLKSYDFDHFEAEETAGAL